MKINRKGIVTRLSNSQKLTYNVLWEIIDHFEQPEGWWHWLLKYDDINDDSFQIEQKEETHEALVYTIRDARSQDRSPASRRSGQC